MKKWTILEWKLTITLLIQTKQGNQKTSFLPLFPQFSVILYPETKTHKYAFESPMITYSPRLRPQIDGKPTKHKILINKSCIHHVFLLVAEQRFFFTSCSWQHFNHQMEEELLISESPTCTSAHLKQNPPLNSRMRSACFFISAARVQWALCHATSPASIHSAASRGHCCAPVTFTVKSPWKDLVGYPGDSADKVITN